MQKLFFECKNTFMKNDPYKKQLYDQFPVSRETSEKLDQYVELLIKWQKAINLVANSTLDQIWLRHIIDSAQLLQYIEKDSTIIDLGSGAGLPALILSILGVDNITMVESDSRKVAFLKEVKMRLNLPINIICQRVENVDLKDFNLITSRGFASLDKTFTLIYPNLNKNHKLLLLKGKNYMSEISDAKANWSFDYKIFASIVEQESVIIEIENITEGAEKHE